MALMGVWTNQSAQKGLEEQILLAGFEKSEGVAFRNPDEGQDYALADRD